MSEKKVVTEAKKRADAKWESKFKQRIVRIPLVLNQKLVDYCNNKGESVNGLIIRLIKEEIENK